MDALKFESEGVKYKLVSDGYVFSIVRTDNFSCMVIPTVYAEQLLLFSRERISSFLEAHVSALVQFHESITHVWEPGLISYCLDPDCVASYINDSRLDDFFNQWISNITITRVKSARK